MSDWYVVPVALRIAAGIDEVGSVVRALPAMVGRDVSVDIADGDVEGTACSVPLLSSLVAALTWWPDSQFELGVAFEDSYLTVRAMQGRLLVRTRYPAVRTTWVTEPVDPGQLGWRRSGERHIQLLGSSMTESELAHLANVLDVSVRRVLGEERVTGFVFGPPEA